MNLKLGICAILLSTLGLGGALYVVINSISGNEPKAQQEAPSKEQSPGKKDLKDKKNPAIKANLQQPKPEGHALRHDEQIIQELTALSDADLAREYDKLAQHLKNDAVFEALEKKSLSAEKAQEAKASLERFTLLSLENTRRKYVAVEPELKDPLYAHRDSLKDIRHILDRY